MASDDQEKFCLKWNEFETNISLAFRELHEENDFLDVTLVCEENQLDAHKIVLSACSPFFRDVLKRNPHKHPLLYLKDVRHTDMQAILTFMYQGEVNVAQSQLNSFLMIAEDLKVKGLTQDGKQKPAQSESSSRVSAEKRPSPDSMSGSQKPAKVTKTGFKTPTPMAVQHYTSNPSSSRTQQRIKVEQDPVNVDMVDVDESCQNQEVEEYQQHGYEEDDYDVNYESLDDSVYSLHDPLQQGIPRNSTGNRDFSHEIGEYNLEEYYQNVPGGHKCNICGHLSQSKRLIKVHLEGKHSLSSGYTCDICNIFHKTQEALRIHKRRHHSQKNGNVERDVESPEEV